MLLDWSNENKDALDGLLPLNFAAKWNRCLRLMKKPVALSDRPRN